MISGEEGIRKPEPEIYALAAERMGLAPEALVFVDDLPGNLKPARALGMATVHHTAAATTIAELEELLGVRAQPPALDPAAQVPPAARGDRPRRARLGDRDAARRREVEQLLALLALAAASGTASRTGTSVKSDPSTIITAPAAFWSVRGARCQWRSPARVDVVERAAAEDEARWPAPRPSRRTAMM